MLFLEDNLMQFRGKNGEWELINHHAFKIKFNKKEFKYKFNESLIEAVLIEPARTPQSKIIIQPEEDKEKEEIAEHISYHEFYYCKDGQNPTGDFQFREGGSMSFKGKPGIWSV